MRKELALRLGFLALLGGGLLLWSQERKPRELTLQIDLSAALPGEISEVDVVVRRSGHVLARHDVQYGASGAPGQVEMLVHAPPGDVEIETTLAYSGKPARRTVEQVRLTADAPARIAPH